MPTKKKNSAMRGMRLDDGTYKAIVQAAKARQFASPSAFMRAAIQKELRSADSTLNESEQRISASLERNSRRSCGWAPRNKRCSLTWTRWRK